MFKRLRFHWNKQKDNFEDTSFKRKYYTVSVNFYADTKEEAARVFRHFDAEKFTVSAPRERRLRTLKLMAWIQWRFTPQQPVQYLNRETVPAVQPNTENFLRAHPAVWLYLHKRPKLVTLLKRLFWPYGFVFPTDIDGKWEARAIGGIRE